MATIQPDEFALRDDAVVLAGGGGNDQSVGTALDDEGWLGEFTEMRSQGAEVALVEIFRVAGVEQGIVEQSEVRHSPAQGFQRDPLCAVQDVVEEVVAGEFVFLHADAG